MTFTGSVPTGSKIMEACVIKFVNYLRLVGGFLRVSSTNKTDSDDIIEILFKVALNSINHHALKD
jgi:acyl-CoA reductase-like NAD-dependent aldehyde dehydrogenase